MKVRNDCGKLLCARRGGSEFQRACLYRALRVSPIMPSLYTQRRMVDVVPRRVAQHSQPSDSSEPIRDLQTILTNAGLQQ